MKSIIWTTNFGGKTRNHCRIIIEEIHITKPFDVKKAKELEDKNYHNEVSMIALKYTKNEVFKQMVERIDELNNKDERTPVELAEHQALISLSDYFRIVF